MQRVAARCGRSCAGSRRQPQPVVLWLSAPAVAAPPPYAPAVAVELLRKMWRHTPFARPATVRGRVSGRIGPLGTWIAAVRAGGRIRVWAVRTGRARNPRAPGQSNRTRAALQTAQQLCRSTFCHTLSAPRWSGASSQVVDGSHDRPSQPGATITMSSRAAAPPGSSAGTARSRRHDHYDNPRERPQAVFRATSTAASTARRLHAQVGRGCKAERRLQPRAGAA